MNGFTRRASSLRRVSSPAASTGLRNSVRNRIASEKTRHEEMEQRPEFAEVILERRPGQAEAMPRLEWHTTWAAWVRGS